MLYQRSYYACNKHEHETYQNKYLLIGSINSFFGLELILCKYGVSEQEQWLHYDKSYIGESRRKRSDC